MGGSKTVKFVHIFSLESLPLYGMSCAYMYMYMYVSERNARWCICEYVCY